MLGKSNVFPLDLIWITHSSDNPQWRKERDIVASVSVISLWSPAAESLLLSTWMRSTSNKFAFYVSLWNCVPSTHISTGVPAVQYPWKPYIPLIRHLNPWSEAGLWLSLRGWPLSLFRQLGNDKVSALLTFSSALVKFVFMLLFVPFSFHYVVVCSNNEISFVCKKGCEIF